MDTVVVLGAGASRSVSYAHLGRSLSPLDTDFVDLLDRLDGLATNQETARRWVLQHIGQLPDSYRHSLEKSFYSLHLRALMAKHLAIDGESPESTVVKNFVTSIDATLRAAHGKSICERHSKMLGALDHGDAIVSFNYDLVAERALLDSRADSASGEFGPWVYGLEAAPETYALPVLLKLHGSSNWRLTKDAFDVRTQSWSEFYESPGYRAAIGGAKISFAVFLPFWEKRVEQQPWLTLWTRASNALKNAKRVVVWGYSLPQTDVRTEQLFSLCLGRARVELCVIDPSPTTKARWRAVVHKAKFWSYSGIDDFLKEPPTWWPSR